MREFFHHTCDRLLRGLAAVMGFLRGIGTGSGRGTILLLILMTADYITGLIAAAKGRSRKTPGGRLSSAACFAGLMKKAAMLGVLLLSHGLDWVVHEGNSMFFTAVLWMYISNEGLSLLENLALCGIPVPARFRRMLERLSGREDDGLPVTKGQ